MKYLEEAMNNAINLKNNALLVVLSIAIFSCSSTNNNQMVIIEKVEKHKDMQASPSPQITITWHDNADNEKGYIIQRRIKSSSLYGKTKILAKNSKSYTDSNVLLGQTYCYLVSAYNQEGRSSSDEVCVDL